MSNELSLQTLIEKVRSDLFAPFAGTELAGKSVYPIFFIDEVELEISVDIQYDVTGGVKVTVPQLVEASLGAGETAGTGHKVRVKLTPILERAERRKLLEERGVLPGIKQATLATVRGTLDDPE